MGYSEKNLEDHIETNLHKVGFKSLLYTEYDRVNCVVSSDLIQFIKENKAPKNLDGIVYWENGKLKINKRKEEKEAGLDESITDYSIFPKEYFKKRFVFEVCDFKVYMGIISSIGCPYNCLFCSCNKLNSLLDFSSSFVIFLKKHLLTVSCLILLFLLLKCFKQLQHCVSSNVTTTSSTAGLTSFNKLHGFFLATCL